MENVNHAPPPCWYIEYRDHGRITLRQDEADRALATGAIRVTAYGQAIAQPESEPTAAMIDATGVGESDMRQMVFFVFKVMVEGAKE